MCTKWKNDCTKKEWLDIVEAMSAKALSWLCNSRWNFCCKGKPACVTGKSIFSLNLLQNQLNTLGLKAVFFFWRFACGNCVVGNQYQLGCIPDRNTKPIIGNNATLDNSIPGEPIAAFNYVANQVGYWNHECVVYKDTPERSFTLFWK